MHYSTILLRFEIPDGRSNYSPTIPTMTSLTIHHDTTGEATVSIKNVVFLLLKDDWRVGETLRKVVEALEALHLYDKTVLGRLMNHLIENCSCTRFDDMEVMQLARGAVEICRNQGKDMTEKYPGYACVAPQWQWTFPQHYAAVA